MAGIVKVDIRNRIALAALDRPDAFNSFDKNTLMDLLDVVADLALKLDVDGVVITGSGRAFSAGGDLKWIASRGTDYARTFYELAGLFHQIIGEIRKMSKPVVAAINGLAAGGGLSLALACDFRVMDASAILLQAYTSKGLSIDGGGTFSLPRLVGMARALEIVAFDEPVDSQQALAWGLVTRVVDDGKSVEKAVQLIEALRKRPISSFGVAKKLLYESFGSSLEVQLKREQEFLSWSADQPAGREGIAAFLEKRDPVFSKS